MYDSLYYDIIYNRIDSALSMLNDDNINYDYRYGNTFLMYCMKYKRYQLLPYFIKLGIDVNAQNRFGYTALMWANKNNSLIIFKILVELGADLDIKNKDGDTVLLIAIKKSHLNIIKYCIAMGANLDVENKYGQTIKGLIVDKNLIKYNIKQEINNSLLYDEDLQNTIIISLVKYNKSVDINLNKQDISGNTILMLILKFDQDLAIKFLDYDIDYNLKNNDGNTTIMIATKYYRYIFIKKFFQRKFKYDNNLVNNKLQTNAMIAIHPRNNSLLSFFIHTFDDLIKQDINGNNCLMLLAITSNGNYLFYYLKYYYKYFSKSICNLVNNDGNTLLMLLIKHDTYFRNEKYEFFSYLTTMGADINIKNKYNDNVLSLILRQRQQDLKCDDQKYMNMLNYSIYNTNLNDFNDIYAIDKIFNKCNLDTCIYVVKNIDLNLQFNNWSGNTILMENFRNLPNIILEYYIENSNLNIFNNNSETILSLSLKSRCYDIFEKCINEKNINLRYKQNKHILHYIVEHKNINLLKKILL